MKVYFDMESTRVSLADGRQVNWFFDIASAVNDSRSYSVTMNEPGDNAKLQEKLNQALSTLDPELRAILEASFGLSTAAKASAGADTSDELAANPGDAVLEEIALRALYNPAKKA